MLPAHRLMRPVLAAALLAPCIAMAAPFAYVSN
jgi:hypothetical protein